MFFVRSLKKSPVSARHVRMRDLKVFSVFIECFFSMCMLLTTFLRKELRLFENICRKTYLSSKIIRYSGMITPIMSARDVDMVGMRMSSMPDTREVDFMPKNESAFPTFLRNFSSLPNIVASPLAYSGSRASRMARMTESSLREHRNRICQNLTLLSSCLHEFCDDGYRKEEFHTRMASGTGNEKTIKKLLFSLFYIRKNRYQYRQRHWEGEYY